MFFWLILLFALICFGVWAHRRSQANKAIFASTMQRINAEHGTSFPIDASGVDLILSNGSTRGSLVFDPTTKKLCFLTSPDRAEVLDYAYIRKWELKWVVVTKGTNISYRNVHFVFSTSDIKRPLLTIPAKGKAHGDIWHSRLGILLT
jgi:hypothetical protein